MSYTLSDIQVNVGTQLNAIREGLKEGNTLAYDPNKKQFISVQKSQKNELNKDIITKRNDIMEKVQEFVASNSIGPEDLNSIRIALHEKYTIRKKSSFAEEEHYKVCLRVINSKLESELKNKFINEVKNEFPDNFISDSPARGDFKDREKEILVKPSGNSDAHHELELYYINAEDGNRA